MYSKQMCVDCSKYYSTLVSVCPPIRIRTQFLLSRTYDVIGITVAYA